MNIEKESTGIEGGAVERKTEEEAFETIINGIGLKPEDFEDKKVLDIGSGPRALEKGLKRAGIAADVVSYDKDLRVLKENVHGDKMAVAGNAFQGLPFKDETFDLIINSAGPFRSRPVDPERLKLFQEALRVLKKDGEIRSNDHYTWSITAIFAYSLAKEDAIKLPEIDFKEFFGNNLQEVNFDERGMPQPDTLNGIDFWNKIYHKLVPDDTKRHALTGLSRNLEENLEKQNIRISARLERVEISNEKYQTFFIIHKKE